MERQRRPLGEILVDLGRITPAQVEAALAHQREHAGYFGDALVALGCVTRDELNWTLADQYDLAFVQLRPENIDLATAALVPAEWARAHLVLPILRAGDTVVAAIADPRSVERLDDVRRFTGAAVVEASLASPENLRALIEAVHGVGSAPVHLARMVAEALDAGARAMGVSTRPGRTVGWYRTDRTVSRHLEAEWAAELEAMVSPLPPLSHSPVYGVRSWPAILTAPGGSWRVECHALGRGDAVEWSADLEAKIPATVAVAGMPDALLDTVRAAVEAGGATIQVHSCERVGHPQAVSDETLEATFPTLPLALGGAEIRSIHLSDRPVAVAQGLLYVLVRGSLSEALRGLRSFSLQAVTLDVDTLSPDDLRAAREVAPVVAFRSRSHDDAGLAPDFSLCLRTDGGGLAWS
ncbi:MAG: hypothetical protein JWM27_4946 [Gemmatimonadetes bacterium]|nr:hypothetical protein [Gemmatimonadota bacterium]